MDAASGTPSAPYAEYDLREASHLRWQLVEPLPSDERALEAELQRLDARLAALDDGTEADYVKGCAILETRKRDFEAQARARFERLETSVAMLFEHECEQARARYAARCEQLKQDMGGEIQREIRRLQRARDGVSVMDRRRLTRHSGNSGGNSNNRNNETNGSGDSSNGGYDANGSTDGASYGTQVTEKKRMEVLLSATPIFRQLDKTLVAGDVDSDLALIKEAMPSFLCDNGEAHTALEDEGIDEDEQRELDDIRYRASQGIMTKRRRLVYNPKRLPEGQEVVVYRTTATPGEKTKPQGSAGRARTHERESETQRSTVAEGTITAATSTQVFVLSKDGSFQRFPVDDWKAGRLTVHEVEPAAEDCK